MARRTILELEAEPGASALHAKPASPASNQDNFEIELKIPASKTNALESNKREKWKTLQRYAKEGKQIVLLIGQTGVAKTVITASVNYAAMVKHASVSIDPVRNQQGAGYLNKAINILRSGNFPAGNRMGDLEYYDTGIYFSGQDTPVTFVEMAGEDFKKFDTASVDRDPFFYELVRFLQLKPRIIIFLVAPADKAHEMDIYFRDCISHLLFIDKELTKQLGVIISKWDLAKKRSPGRVSVKEFIRKQMPATHALMGRREINTERRYFRFSVGKVTPAENGLPEKIDSDLNLKDCYPILHWMKVALVDTPVREKLKTIENTLRDKKKELEAVKEGLKDIESELTHTKWQESGGKMETGTGAKEPGKTWFNILK
ncbi:MAG: hypothetical protein DYG98_02050 [Haliscomenobacteraceae bacterium CHB4]|nr:hypothetical protein [Saprospiraceae bacterium]MCE7921814.1 hypothetical protein [Haliscomenobacteraceae bacterium CHB4]